MILVPKLKKILQAHAQCEISVIFPKNGRHFEKCWFALDLVAQGRAHLSRIIPHGKNYKCVKFGALVW